MKMLAFANRCLKELLRDRLTLIFGLGFPLVLLGLLTVIQHNIPVNLFELSTLTPGIAVFGLSFVSLFAGLLIAKDRSSSFMLRLFTAPMRAWDFLGGYTLPLLPLCMVQMLVCFAAAVLLGLKLRLSILFCILVLLPAAILYISIGLLFGSLLNEKQVGSISGALLTNLSAWLSGTWFSLDLVGGWFRKLAYALPFAHAVDAGRAALRMDLPALVPHLLWVTGYALFFLILAVLVFRKKMYSDA